MRKNTGLLSRLTLCTQTVLSVSSFCSIMSAIRGSILSDTTGATEKTRVSWGQIAGVAITVGSLAISGVTFLNRVDAKADYALQQIAEVKASQRQMSVDNRDDLKTLNTKVDQVLLLLGRANPPK